MTTVSLYNEDGISIMIDNYGDITRDPNAAEVRVIGHAIYACSLEDAERAIQAAYHRAGECPHIDFTENQDGDRTCRECGVTT